MKLALGAAALAAALTVSAHAATASGIELQFSVSGTCTLTDCTVTVKNTVCVERFGLPPCTVDPVTVTLTPIAIGLGTTNCVYRGGGATASPMVVHTQSFGDVRVDARYHLAAGVFAVEGLSTATGSAGVLAAAGPTSIVGIACLVPFTGRLFGALALAGV